MMKQGSSPSAPINDCACKTAQSAESASRGSTVTGHRQDSWWSVDSPVIEHGITVVMLALLGLLIWATCAPAAAPEYVIRAAQQTKQPAGATQGRAWIICQSFRYRLCRPALNVFWCESTLRPWAANGQYLGIAAMSRYNRTKYGHGPGTWAQARAARKLWNDRHWSPWEDCR